MNAGRFSQNPAYRAQQARIARRASERAVRRYRAPALLLFAAGLAVSCYGQGPIALTLGVLLGCAAVFLHGIATRLRGK